MKVTVVATVKDAASRIGPFLSSLAGQTRPPDEVIVVDGGSTDGTRQTLDGAAGITAISEPGANIARGRNIAVRAAAHDLIAVTDADCVLAPDWLERLIEPLELGADVSAGFYRPVADSFLQVCTAAATIPEEDEVGPGWMPSSRSLAFRREAFEAAGGYPEWLDIGEDMYLNHRFVDSGARIDLAPRAVVYWEMRPTLAATWRQYVRYAEGDALAEMYPGRHAGRFAAYAFAVVALASRRRVLLLLAAAGGAARVARPIRRARRRIPPGSPGRGSALIGVPAMVGFTDAAKMWGYVLGLSRRAGTRPGPGPAPGP
jgi:glycosyltransferase involved in cell wall biosynthesis